MAGVKLLDGIDTLLVKLLIRLDMSPELQTLVSNSAEVRVKLVERDLQKSGNLPALALLYSHNNLEEDALRAWQVGHSIVQPHPFCLPLPFSKLTRNFAIILYLFLHDSRNAYETQCRKDIKRQKTAQAC